MIHIPEWSALPRLADVDISLLFYLLLGLVAAFATWIDKRRKQEQIGREARRHAAGKPAAARPAQPVPAPPVPAWQRKLRDFVETELQQRIPRPAEQPPVIVPVPEPPACPNCSSENVRVWQGWLRCWDCGHELGRAEAAAARSVPVAPAKVEEVYRREKPVAAPPSKKAARHPAPPPTVTSSAGLAPEFQWLLSPPGPRQAVVGGIVIGPPRALQQPAEW